MLMIENYAFCLQPCAGLCWWLRIMLSVYNHVQDYVDDWELCFLSTTMCRIMLMIENYAFCLQPCAGLCWWLRIMLSVYNHVQDCVDDWEQRPGGAIRRAGSTDTRTEHAGGGTGLHRHFSPTAVLQTHLHGEAVGETLGWGGMGVRNCSGLSGISPPPPPPPPPTHPLPSTFCCLLLGDVCPVMFSSLDICLVASHGCKHTWPVCVFQ